MKKIFFAMFTVALAALSNLAFAEVNNGTLGNIAPEPVSTTLFLLGGATLAARRLRRKK